MKREKVITLLRLVEENGLKIDVAADEIVENCFTYNVRQQRELLLAYEKYTSFKCLGKETPNISKDMVEDFLAYSKLCDHKNQTQHFSDVFGHYCSCLDCGKDL